MHLLPFTNLFRFYEAVKARMNEENMNKCSMSLSYLVEASQTWIHTFKNKSLLNDVALEG